MTAMCSLMDLMNFFSNTCLMSPQQLLSPVIRKQGKIEMTLHGNEVLLEPPQEDPTHPHINTTIGTNQPLVQLNTLLGRPMVTGHLVGGMKAPPEEILVGPPALSPIHRTLGTKTRDNAKAKMLMLFLLKNCSSIQFCYPSHFFSVLDIPSAFTLCSRSFSFPAVHWLCLG